MIVLTKRSGVPDLPNVRPDFEDAGIPAYPFKSIKSKTGKICGKYQIVDQTSWGHGVHDLPNVRPVLS